ncbi:hypothetical protein C5167_004814, partial [Papaver somniferum]
ASGWRDVCDMYAAAASGYLEFGLGFLVEGVVYQLSFEISDLLASWQRWRSYFRTKENRVVLRF